MGYGRGGFNRGGRGGSRKESNYTRVGNLFQSKFVPDKATEQLSTRCDGKYLDAVREVINNNDAVYFTFTVWRDGEHPVLSVAPAKEKEASRGRSFGGNRGGSGNSNRGYSGRPAGNRDVRSRGIEDDRDDSAADDAGDAEAEQDNNWEK
jgi:hypothetical protein